MHEEYQVLSQFVDRVERGLIRQREKEMRAEEERQKIAQAVVPEEAYGIPLEETGIPLRFTTILGGAGFPTLGDLMLQLSLDADVILALDGIGPKAMKDIKDAMAKYSYLTAAPETTEETAAEAGVEAEIVSEIAVETAGEPVAEVESEVLAEALQPEEMAVAVEPAEAELLPALEAESAPAADEEAEEAQPDLDQIFTLPTEVLDMVTPLEDEELDDEDQPKKKKKKKKFVQMEYDPDKDVVVYKKKSKRSGTDGWDSEWES